MNWVRRPSGLSLTNVIPDTSNGGSCVDINPMIGKVEEKKEERFARGRGLPRYQNSKAQVSRLFQRIFDLSCSAM